MEAKKYKVLAFCALHYVGDYWKEALLSVKDYADKVHVAFSVHPSQGFGCDVPNPDKEEDMRRVAEEVLGDKLIWDTYPTFHFEGAHRNEMYRHAAGMDFVLVFDADEVIVPEDIEPALDQCLESGDRRFGITGFVHLYKSFSWGQTDHWNPIRIINLKSPQDTEKIGIKMRVFHFSYAQREEILRYKWMISGHKDELRQDYLDGTWLQWTPEKKDEILYLHPSSKDVWERAYPVNKEEMPQFMRLHKNWDKHVIE